MPPKRIRLGYDSPDAQSKADESSPSNSRQDDQQRDGREDEGSPDTSKEKSDEEQQDKTPTPVGFWHPTLKAVRLEAFRKWTLTTGFLMAFILCCLSIYWGVSTCRLGALRSTAALHSDMQRGQNI